VVVDVRSGVRPLDYLVPDDLAAHLEVGSEVRVALGPRRLRGWVVALGVQPESNRELKPLLAWRGQGPPASVVATAQWSAWRYGAQSPAPFLTTASSPRVVRSLPSPGPLGQRTARGLSRSGGAGRGRSGSARPSAPRAPWAAPLERAAARGGGVVRVGPALPLAEVAEAALEALLRCRPSAPGSPAGAAPGLLVVVPELDDAERVAAGLQAAGWPVGLLPESWPEARAGGRVVVGTRSAAFGPLPALWGGVVLDGHDRALKEQGAPTWWAPEVLVHRARQEGVPWLAVSPCPSASLAALGPLEVPTRTAERRAWPMVEVVDLGRTDPREGLVSSGLVRWCRWAEAAPGRRVVVVVNRRGEAQRVRCARCEELQRCQICAAPLGSLPAEGLAGPRLVCPGGHEERPMVCAACGSTRLRLQLPGADRLARALERAAGIRVARQMAGEVAAPEAAVVVGTEAALRGAPADLVVFADFDAQLLAARLGAGEKALGLLARAARQVGGSASVPSPARAPGRVVLQTRQPNHPVVRAAVLGDPGIVLRVEQEARDAVGLSPAHCLVVLRGPGSLAVARSLGEGLEDGFVQALGQDRAEVRSRDRRGLLDRLAALRRPAGLIVEVDPELA